MILEKIKVAVETSTNVKFITSIPVTITVREALPILLKSYLAVVRQNYDQEDSQGLSHANRIKRITKNGFLIPLSEEVIHVLSDGDSLFITVDKHEKKEGEHQPSKKEKLEAKKEEKNIEKIREKILEESKSQTEKKPSKPAANKKEASESKKEVPKKEQAKSSQNRANITSAGIDKLLSKIRGEPVSPPVAAIKPKKFIVAPASQDDDSS